MLLSLLLLLVGAGLGQDATAVYTLKSDDATVDAGTRCAFPFKYRDETYTTCTNERYGSTYWCSTTSEYDKKWGDCKARENCKFFYCVCVVGEGLTSLHLM